AASAVLYERACGEEVCRVLGLVTGLHGSGSGTTCRRNSNDNRQGRWHSPVGQRQHLLKHGRYKPEPSVYGRYSCSECRAVSSATSIRRANACRVWKNYFAPWKAGNNHHLTRTDWPAIIAFNRSAMLLLLLTATGRPKP